MSRAPLYALTAAVIAVAAVATVITPEPRIASAEVPPAPPLPDGPPPTAAVLAGAVEASVLTEIEVALTDQAATRVTSTTTTTTPVASSTSEAEAAEASGSPSGDTSPPPTNPPATTSTTQPPPDPPPDGYFDSAAESDFAGRIAAVRSSNGVPGLIRDGSLDSRAREWARHMAETGSLSHSNTGSLMPPWTAVGENVGQGGSVSQIFDLLAGSSGHLANMVGDFTHVGIGVWVDPGGTMWTAHLFARS